MHTTRKIDETRSAIAALRNTNARIAFVPTMGALHRGHLALVEAARAAGAAVVVSIFVNPTQFGQGEDLDQYPRDEAGDLAKCEQAGVDLAFLPSVADIYPPDAATTIHVARLTDGLCGPHRPGHFDGVATVVAKLFHIVTPDAAYFGEKDFQQLQVIRQLTRDLDLPIEIVGVPTVREPDGLALSSRNAYLTPDQRRQAASLYAALQLGAREIQAGQTDPETVIAAMTAHLEAAGPCEIHYLCIVDPDTLQPVRRITEPVRIALAVSIGDTRLIDNLGVAPAANSA